MQGGLAHACTAAACKTDTAENNQRHNNEGVGVAEGMPDSLAHANTETVCITSLQTLHMDRLASKLGERRSSDLGLHARWPRARLHGSGV